MLAVRTNRILVRGFCSKPPTWYAAPLDRFEKWLQMKHPKVYKIQRTVVDGGKSCFADLKTYVRVSSNMKQGKALQEFTRQELEVYILTPVDIQKLVVIVIVVALPMTIFILAIALAFFPRLLLTRHFWTIEQTEKFLSIVLDKRRRHHYAQIADALSNEIQRIEGGNNALAAEFVQAIKHPPMTLRQLEDYVNVLEKVNVDSLPPMYQFHLSRAHELWTWPKSRIRLRRHAEILAALDSKLSQERVDDMSLPDLKQSLYIRQFDIAALSDDQERQLLKDWLALTSRNSASISTTLHAPIISQLHLIKSNQ